MALKDVFVASDKLELATSRDVTRAEKVLRTRFPEGYGEYVTTLGAGIENDYVEVNMPRTILQDVGWMQATWREFASYGFFDDYTGLDMFPISRIVESIPIASTDVGDTMVFHPADPSEIVCLPRDFHQILRLGSTLDEALWFLVSQQNPLGTPAKVRVLTANGAPADRPVRYFRSHARGVEETYMLPETVRYIDLRESLLRLLATNDDQVLFLEHLDQEGDFSEAEYFEALVREGSAVIQLVHYDDPDGSRLGVSIEYDADRRSETIAGLQRFLGKVGTKKSTEMPVATDTVDDDAPLEGSAEPRSRIAVAHARSPYANERPQVVYSRPRGSVEKPLSAGSDAAADGTLNDIVEHR